MDELFITQIIASCAESISFFYSGERLYSSVLYADILRKGGYCLVNIETFCPLCGAEVQFKKWNLPMRLLGRAYLVIQSVMKRLGVYRPANIITFVKVK